MPRQATRRPAVMNTRETADYVGLSESSLEKMRGTDRGPPFVTMDAAVRYRISDVDEWLARLVHRSIRERRQSRSVAGRRPD